MPIEAQRFELVHAEKGNMFLGIRFGWIEGIIKEIKVEPISARRRNIGKQTKKGPMHCPTKITNRAKKVPTVDDAAATAVTPISLRMILVTTMRLMMLTMMIMKITREDDDNFNDDRRRPTTRGF